MSRSRVLITGATGLLGRELIPVLSDQYQVVAATRADADITDRPSVLSFFQTVRPNAVLHTAAFSDVDGCEREPEAARRVNVEGTKYIAEACQSVNAKLLFVSTDYVFNGQKPTPYTEDDDPAPVNVYGETKLEAERIVGEMTAPSVIVRTGWLYGAHGKDFIKSIVAALRLHDSLKVVNDQRGNPTNINDLSEQIKVILDSNTRGLFHSTSAGETTWYDYARLINEVLELGREIVACTSEEWGAAARRPANSSLENKRLTEMKLDVMPHYLDRLCQFLTQNKGELINGM